MKINKQKFDEYDIGAAYHQAWHEYKEGHPKYYNDKFMPEEYGKGTIPENVFKFIYACQKWI